MKSIDVLHYLILRFYDIYGKPLYGRKKIQKLMFLIEHYDLKDKKVRKSKGLTGYKFLIWTYGPFSKEIYDDLDRLIDEELIREEVVGSDSMSMIEGIVLDSYIDDGYPKRMFIYRPNSRHFKDDLDYLKSELSVDVVNTVDNVLRMFGNLMPYELESLVNKLLHLDLPKKIKYWGLSIDEYLEREGIA